jgi:hypothetical protein
MSDRPGRTRGLNRAKHLEKPLRAAPGNVQTVGCLFSPGQPIRNAFVRDRCIGVMGHSLYSFDEGSHRLSGLPITGKLGELGLTLLVLFSDSLQFGATFALRLIALMLARALFLPVLQDNSAFEKPVDDRRQLGLEWLLVGLQVLFIVTAAQIGLDRECQLAGPDELRAGIRAAALEALALW